MCPSPVRVSRSLPWIWDAGDQTWCLTPSGEYSRGQLPPPAERDPSALPQNEDAVDAPRQSQRVVVPQGRRKQPVGYGLVRDRFEEAA